MWARHPATSFMRTYRVPWPASEVVDDPLAGEIKSAGFEPVFLDPSEALRRQQRQWIISSPQAVKLPNAAMDEIDRIITAENLKALVHRGAGPEQQSRSRAGQSPAQAARLRAGLGLLHQRRSGRHRASRSSSTSRRCCSSARWATRRSS